MIADKGNPQLIPTELLNSWAQTAQSRLEALLQNPPTTMGHVEELLEAQGRQLLLPILKAATQRIADQQPFQCPQCQEPLHVEAKNRSRSLATVFGSLDFSRRYGWCSRCQTYGHPADQTLGLQPQAPASPRVQEISALMSIRSPFAQAAQAAHRLTGLPLNHSGLHRDARRQGQRAIQCRQEDVALSHTPQGVVQLSARSGTRPRAPFTLIIQIDAWNIRERGEHGGKTAQRRKQGQEPERWHWVYTATCFRLEQRVQTSGGRRVITQRGYVATRPSLESFTPQLYVEALQRGLLDAEQVLIIAAGAIWIWNLATDRFKDAKQRVDLYHVKEHLHELARNLYGESSAEANAWLQPLLRFLDRRKDGALDVLHHLEGLRKSFTRSTARQKEALEKQIGYFTTHHQRMDYKEARSKGEPVGSGVIESPARQYQTRFKCTGQFWTLEGDEPLLALATLVRNGRWHRLFPHAGPPPKGADG